jgi:hypothetical protein
MQQERALTYEERERVLERLNSLRASFIGLFAKLVNDLSYNHRQVPIECLIYELGGFFTKVHYVLHYCFLHGKLLEAEKLIGGLDFIIDLYLTDVYNLRMLHDKLDCLVKDIFGHYPGLCFVFGDYKNCKEV